MSNMVSTANSIPLRKYSSSFVESEEFYKENSQFFTFGPSQVAVRMIVNMVNDVKVPFELIHLQLQQIVLQIMQETVLNEIQIALWSIFIENFVWNERQKPIRTYLIYSALLAKERMGENVEYLLIKYSEKESYFRIFYQRWTADKQLFEVSLKEINIQYLKLSKGKGIKVNYRFVVDDILLHYLPYNHANLPVIEEDQAETQENLILPIYLLTQESETPNLSDQLELIPPPLVHKNNSKSFCSNDFSISLFLSSSWVPEISYN